MPKYTTTVIKNLSTGQPFVFEVSDDDLKSHEVRKESARRGISPLLPSVEEVVKNFEISRLPTFDRVLGIWIENGFSEKLFADILKDFGLSAGEIRKMCRDKLLISDLKPWFQGITCDGGRAARTMMIVYGAASSRYIDTSAVEKPRKIGATRKLLQE